jgi:hypothetical protein
MLWGANKNVFKGRKHFGEPIKTFLKAENASASE